MPPRTILVVDDTADLRRLTATILRRADFDVVEAENGPEALAVALQRPDLIVLDVHMPGMDGFEVCRRLKTMSATASIPVVYLSSAYRQERDRVRGLQSGGAAYLVRPLDPADLVATVEALLRADRPDVNLALFDHASDGVWAADEAGRICYVNARCAAMLRDDGQTLLGQDFTGFVDPAGRPAVIEMLDRQHGFAGPREIRCWRRDGTDFWAVVSAMPLLDSTGRVRGTVGIMIDVTARMREAQERGRLASIVESSSDAVIAMTLDGFIVSWNPAATQMYGYTADEAIGRSAAIILPPERHQHHVEILHMIRQGRAVPPIDTVRRRKDGTTLEVSRTLSPIHDSAGQVIGIACIERDIRDRIRAEAAERDAAKLASVASLALTASHEINNPLTVIVGALELLRDCADAGGMGDAVERALAASSEIQTIIGRMHHITRLERHQLSPHLPDMLDLEQSSDGSAT